MNDTLLIIVIAVGVSGCLNTVPRPIAVPAPPMLFPLSSSRSAITADRFVSTVDSGAGLAGEVRRPATLVLEGPVRRIYSSTNLVDWKLEAGGEWDRVIIYETPTENQKFYRHE